MWKKLSRKFLLKTALVGGLFGTAGNLRAEVFWNLPWLSSPPGVAAQGRGGLGMAHSEGVSSALRNPAALAGLEAWELYLAHQFSPYPDTARDNLALGFKAGRHGGWAITADYSTFGKVVLVDFNAGTGAIINSRVISPYGLSLGLAYGHDLGSGWSTGVQAKYFREDLGLFSKTGGAVDLGLRWAQAGRGWSAGASVLNIGPDVNGFPIPTQVRSGASYRVQFQGDMNQALLLGLEGMVGTAASKYSTLGLGAEYVLAEKLALRAGYLFPGPALVGGYSAGVGVALASYEVDYAFVNESGLKDSHRLSLSVAF